MKVYIAAPYTKGDACLNVRAAIQAAEELIEAGHVPFVPHLTHLWHLIVPHGYEFWLEYDLVWLEVCDAVLRLPGESAGADVEVHVARKYGMPVFFSTEEVCDAN